MTEPMTREQALDRHLRTDPNVLVARQMMIDAAELHGTVSAEPYQLAVKRSIEAFNERAEARSLLVLP